MKTFTDFKRASARLRTLDGAKKMAEEINDAAKLLEEDYDLSGAEELKALAKEIVGKDYSKYDKKASEEAIEVNDESSDIDEEQEDETSDAEEDPNDKVEVEEKPKAAEKTDQTKKKSVVTKYTYPFKLHFAGKNQEVDHIFKEGTAYSDEQIKTAMLQHQFYEFSGKVAFSYLKDDNVLVPIFEQFKKG